MTVCTDTHKLRHNQKDSWINEIMIWIIQWITYIYMCAINCSPSDLRPPPTSFIINWCLNVNRISPPDSNFLSYVSQFIWFGLVTDLKASTWLPIQDVTAPLSVSRYDVIHFLLLPRPKIEMTTSKYTCQQSADNDQKQVMGRLLRPNLDTEGGAPHIRDTAPLVFLSHVTHSQLEN